jgi:predicted transcriptional regulator
MHTKVLTAHIPLDLSEKVDGLAARLQRSRGWIVKQALAAWVERQQVEPVPTRGFAEAQQPFEAEFMKQDNAIARAAVETLKSLRKTTTLGDITWRELRDAGRR